MMCCKEIVPIKNKYSEDLKFASNKDMGPKSFFEMACSGYDLTMLHIR
jgi:hypothetical protein